MSSPFTFTPAQADNMRAELRAEHEKRADWFAVVNALGISANSLNRFLFTRTETGSPALAFRVAMLRGKPVDEVLNGAPHGHCPPVRRRPALAPPRDGPRASDRARARRGRRTVSRRGRGAVRSFPPATFEAAALMAHVPYVRALLRVMGCPRRTRRTSCRRSPRARGPR